MARLPFCTELLSTPSLLVPGYPIFSTTEYQCRIYMHLSLGEPPLHWGTITEVQLSITIVLNLSKRLQFLRDYECLDTERLP